MIPINPRPGLTEIRGLNVYPNLASIDRPVDMVEVFRKPEDLLGIAKEAIAIGAKVLWGQIGVRNDEAARLAEDDGKDTSSDRGVLQADGERDTGGSGQTLGAAESQGGTSPSLTGVCNLSLSGMDFKHTLYLDCMVYPSYYRY